MPELDLIISHRYLELHKFDAGLEELTHLASIFAVTLYAAKTRMVHLSDIGDKTVYKLTPPCVVKVYDEVKVLMSKHLTQPQLEYRFAPIVLEVAYPPIPFTTTVTHQQKLDRTLAFFELYVEYGVIMPCALAVGVPYPRLLAWINEIPDLKIAKEIAEQMRIQRLEDTAMQMALEGDGPMLKFMLGQLSPKFRKGSRAAQTERGVDAKEAEDKLSGIIKRAEDGVLERLTSTLVNQNEA